MTAVSITEVGSWSGTSGAAGHSLRSILLPYISISSSSIGVQELLPIPPTVIRPGLGYCGVAGELSEQVGASQGRGGPINRLPADGGVLMRLGVSGVHGDPKPYTG